MNRGLLPVCNLPSLPPGSSVRCCHSDCRLAFLAHFFSGPQYFTSIVSPALLSVRQRLERPGMLSIATPAGCLRAAGPDQHGLIQLITNWQYYAWRYTSGLSGGICALLGNIALSPHYPTPLRNRLLRLIRPRIGFVNALPLVRPYRSTGFIQFGNFRRGQHVVAAAYPLAQLGVYSVALTMAMALV